MNPTSSQTILLELPEGESTHDYVVESGSECTIIVQSFTPKDIRAKLSVHLIGENSRATIVGLIIAKDMAKIDLHTMQFHEAPSTTSNLLVKAALWDSAKCSVEGGIRVELGAQKTNAYQRNENLLLSPNAVATSKPSLEILADDVRCTHGATMGPISEEELWYLATRGIEKSKAVPLIISGFFQKGLEMIDDEKVKQKLFDSIQKAL